MFIEQGFNQKNKFWKYLLGSLVIILFAFIGQVPFAVAIFYKNFRDGKTVPKNQNDWLKILDSNLTLFLILISFVFALFGVFLVIKYFHKQTILSITTSRKSIDWKRFFFSFTLWSIVTIVNVYISYSLNPSNFIWNFKLIPFLLLAITSIVLIPIQTSCEEYIFRGYLMQGFGNLFRNKWLPLIMTSVIFGAMHILNPEVDKLGYIILVYYIGTGFLLGIMTLMDEGMELSLGFHAANNLLGVLLVTSNWTVFQTNSVLKDISTPKAGVEIFIPVLIIYPTLMLILSKKYKWINWKERLTGIITKSA